MNGQIVYRGQEKLVAPYFGFQPGAINRWREADFPRAFSARLPDRRCRSNPIGAFANGMFGLIP
jgi:hypothetical protein